MTAKLTLRLDADVIQSAKRYSKQVGKPVSRLVEDYFAAVTSARLRPIDVPPLVQALRGALAGTAIDEADYRRHLEEKYQ